ncbi:MAG: UDP-glucose 6-dehydrogenase [Actinobacteria bacterium QS_8_72_14]|nr:MAG: UDP-glucose 6-dehydrogenase [Actinobacteria bacterium QS_8_72_14]
MRVAVIGVGHVGLVTLACLAADGHVVVGLDDDSGRVGDLRAGRMPFFEVGLAELVAEQVEAGRAGFTQDPAAAIAGAEVVFICVGTPSRGDGSPDLSAVQRAAATVATHATRPVVVAEKSTVPVRTGERIKHALSLQAHARGAVGGHEVASNPEFLREGRAVADAWAPDRVVVGADSPGAHEVMGRLYGPLLARHGCAYVATDVATAELIKHASNAFLATKISFINAVARVCERAGADVATVAEAMGHDPRIGRAFLDAGIGYGGSCFPKDVQAFAHIAADLGYDFGVLRETERVNAEARRWPIVQLRRLLWNLADKTVAVLGVAFKPGTDDVRAAPALDVIAELVAEGTTVRAHDPVAVDALADRFPEVVRCDKAEAALAGAHAVVVATEWDEYRAIRPHRLAELLEYPIVVDGRGVWDTSALRHAGFHVARVGAPLEPVPGA